MALVINTNVASLNTQRQLMDSGNALDQATERLSSGNRINSAKDDAAGLAISNRMTSQIRGLDQAIRNANDGVSMIQTAEGALQETSNILQRMRELSIQSANGIYTDGDRETLNAEVTQLREEMDRIAEETSFNGQRLLDGSLGQVNLQVGDMANQVIGVEVGTMDSETLGGAAGGDIIGAAMDLNEAPTGGTAAALNLAGDVTINGQTLSSGALNGASTIDEVLEVINDGVSNVEASTVTEMTGEFDGDGVIRGDDALSLDLVNPDGSTNSYEVKDTGSMEELAEKITSESGGKIEASVNDDGRLSLASVDGGQITVTDDDAGEAAGLTDGNGDVTADPRLSLESTDGEGITVEYGTAADADILGIDARSEAGDITGQAVTATDEVLAEGDVEINGVALGEVAGGTSATDQAQSLVDEINDVSDQTGVVASLDGDAVELNSVDGTEMSIKLSGAADLGNTGLKSVNDADSVGNSVADIDISTQAGAQSAIDVIDRALTTINETRADMGAINNRLDFTVSNLSNVSEKTSAAQSRIMDADFAAETANLSKAQVLQQAAQAMLAQANARPQQVLSLLQ